MARHAPTKTYSTRQSPKPSEGITLMHPRPSPKDKPVSLFVTCIVDMIYPDTGMSVVKILEHLNIPVDFPMGQTCCGQPAFNSGYRAEARTVAEQFLKTFQ